MAALSPVRAAAIRSARAAGRKVGSAASDARQLSAAAAGLPAASSRRARSASAAAAERRSDSAAPRRAVAAVNARDGRPCRRPSRRPAPASEGGAAASSARTAASASLSAAARRRAPRRPATRGPASRRWPPTRAEERPPARRPAGPTDRRTRRRRSPRRRRAIRRPLDPRRGEEPGRKRHHAGQSDPARRAAGVGPEPAVGQDSQRLAGRLQGADRDARLGDRQGPRGVALRRRDRQLGQRAQTVLAAERPGRPRDRRARLGICRRCRQDPRRAPQSPLAIAAERERARRGQGHRPAERGDLGRAPTRAMAAAAAATSTSRAAR